MTRWSTRTRGDLAHCADRPGAENLTSCWEMLELRRRRAIKLRREPAAARWYHCHRSSACWRGEIHQLFNSSLEGNTRRAIDLREGENIDEAAFTQLIRAAVAANSAARAGRAAKKK